MTANKTGGNNIPSANNALGRSSYSIQGFVNWLGGKTSLFQPLPSNPVKSSQNHLYTTPSNNTSLSTESLPTQISESTIQTPKETPYLYNNKTPVKLDTNTPVTGITGGDSKIKYSCGCENKKQIKLKKRKTKSKAKKGKKSKKHTQSAGKKYEKL